MRMLEKRAEHLMADPALF